MKTAIFLLLTSFIFCGGLKAQTLYVDAQKGRDDARGTLDAPLASLQEAVALAGDFSGNDPVTIKLAPGLYNLTTRLNIKTKNVGNTAATYTLEAAIMPNDTNWHPWLMPVIQSVSFNNDSKYFDHCAGVMADRANVCIRGLKFVGNANPAVEYYYPIVRDSLTLNNLDISQCYFIGDRNGDVVQGAIYAEGPGIHVDHCVFYGCKNAVLVFDHISDFAVTHTIIYDAYECAVWYGDGPFDVDALEKPFNFSHNIVSHCHFLWASSKGRDHSYYRFDHSLICENENCYGMQNGNGGVMPLPAKETYTENDIRKSGKVRLVEVQTEGLPQGYLNLAPGSDGKDIGAGIFLNK
jgi:hypothetical protein